MPLDLGHKRWAAKAQDMRFTELERVRRSAEQWRNGLGGLTALIATVAIVKGPDSVSDLSNHGRVIVAALLGLGFLALLFGSYQAMRAAFGTPGQEIDLTGENLSRWEKEQTKTALKAIRLSRTSFIGGLLLVFSAVGSSWFLTDGEGVSRVAITTNRGTTCGALDSYSQVDIRLSTHHGTVRFDHDEVLSLRLLESCSE